MSKPSEARLQEMQEEMVRSQLARRGISNPQLLEAFRSVPRERFVAIDLRKHAYEDRPLPIQAGQTISQPYVVALMIDALDLEPSDRVLEIGCGSGYAAAILSCIASEIETVERIETLANQAAKTLQALGYANVHVHCGDGTLGWPERAPYDAIIVAAGGPSVPEALKAQLKIGGRLVIPTGEQRDSHTLLKVTRGSETDYRTEDLGGVRFVPLIGQQGW
jgi:protein-L-isoaspartate(D-aspartate) O-methyltransferase